jgi:hypothetical protein
MSIPQAFLCFFWFGVLMLFLRLGVTYINEVAGVPGVIMVTLLFLGASIALLRFTEGRA